MTAVLVVLVVVCAVAARLCANAADRRGEPPIEDVVVRYVRGWFE